ncbi:MAG: hypothetical protein E7521_05545 [Ruminococcaceae bacterium]|nr:hypothetical protein [Oscillospiraceae bacterium]
MKFNSLAKKIICFSLATIMLLTTAGCVKVVKKRKPKKKVIVTEEIIVNNDNQSSDNNIILDNNNVQNDVDNTTNEKVWPERPLPEKNNKAQKVEKYQEVFEPEFEYEYADWSGPEGYVLVYSHKEPNNRIPAANLVTYFKDNYNISLGTPVKDNSAEAQNATKKILVGDTIFKTSTLEDGEYAVTLCSNGDLFFEGGHYAMVESAEEWFETVKIESGKVATLKGGNDLFKSTVTVGGKTFNYAWGDEFDGDALIDSEKWSQGPFTIYSDMAQIHGDRHFNSVENGRLRMTADVYYDETNAEVNYAISGRTATDSTMLFRNGYVECRVRMPYDKGAFPAIWTMSYDTALEKQVPNYEKDDGYGVYKNRVWDLEFDLFESFSDRDKFTTTIHKWYTNIDNYREENGSEKADVYIDFGDGVNININDKLLFPNWNVSSDQATSAYYWAYSGDPSKYSGRISGSKPYEWVFTEEEQKTINNEYHVYSYLYTGNHCTVYFDGEVFLDWDWDPAFDYVDNIDISKNNNGVGFNFWHYMIFDMMIYSPVRTEKDADDRVDPSVMPHNMFIDYLRIYQDPTDASQAICFPNGQD